MRPTNEPAADRHAFRQIFLYLLTLLDHASTVSGMLSTVPAPSGDKELAMGGEPRVAISDITTGALQIADALWHPHRSSRTRGHTQGAHTFIFIEDVLRRVFDYKFPDQPNLLRG
jgi:hypothetical protein